MTLPEPVLDEHVDPKEFIMGQPEWEFTFYVSWPDYREHEGMMLSAGTRTRRYTHVVLAPSKTQAKKEFYAYVQKLLPVEDIGGNPIPLSRSLRIENIRQINEIVEDVDPKEFIMGDYPVGDLIQRGYQQNPRHHWWYSKMLSNQTAVEVQLGGTEKGPYDERGYIVVPWHNTMGVEHEFWTGVAPFKDVGAAVDKVEQVLGAFPETHWINDDHTDKAKRTELYKALEGLTDESGAFPGSPVVEAVTPRDFILGQGPWVEFKSRMEELGWEFDKTKQVPTIHGTTVEEHVMRLLNDVRGSGDTLHIEYTAYIAEFTRDGVQRLCVTADGMSYMFTGKTKVNGDAMLDYVPFGIEFVAGIGSGSHVQSDGSYEQPVDMGGAEFAELIDDEVRARRGPKDYPAQADFDREDD